MSNIPDATENARLDALTAYCATILAGLSGDRLEAAVSGHARRLGRSDSALRQSALEFTHPDDLVETLVTRGYSLASVGVESIKLG